MGDNANANGHTAQDSIVLEEEIDPNYVPSEQEVIDYAKWMGMDLDADKDLFWIAREGLMAPLPTNWKPCKTKDTDDIYYFNFATGESTWDHPCDGYYKKLYEEEKKKKEIRIKESSDENRSKAKKDVQQILGTKEKKKKTQPKPLDSPSTGLRTSAESPLPAVGLKKPLPELRKAPLSNSLSQSFETHGSSHNLLSADAKPEGGGMLGRGALAKPMDKPSSSSYLGGSLMQDSPSSFGAQAKGPQFSDDSSPEKATPSYQPSPSSSLSAPKGFFKDDKEEDKGLAPLSGRGL
eukprot:gene42170-51494_t